MDNLLMSHLVSLSPEELDLNSLIYERYDKIKNIPIKESLVETISLYLNSLPTKNSYELAYQRIADDYLHWKFNNWMLQEMVYGSDTFSDFPIQALTYFTYLT